MSQNPELQNLINQGMLFVSFADIQVVQIIEHHVCWFQGCVRNYSVDSSDLVLVCCRCKDIYGPQPELIPVMTTCTQDPSVF